MNDKIAMAIRFAESEYDALWLAQFRVKWNQQQGIQSLFLFFGFNRG